MKYIYLDQNKWIDLARGWYKGKGEIYEIVSELKRKIRLKEIVVVVSLINLKETLKRIEEGSRNRLLELIFDISQGSTIAPFRDWIIEYEIENLFLEKLGKKVNFQSKVIKKGISGIIGMEATLVDNVSEEIEKEQIEKVNSLETFKLIYSTQKSADRARETSAYLEEKTPKIEEIRIRERSGTNKQRQSEEVFKRFFRGFVVPEIIKFYPKYGFSITNIDMDIGELKEIMKKFPAIYTYYTLSGGRDRNLNRKIQSNDLNDIMSFTMGIAYCDIVFGEKMFVNIARHSKLDELYNTTIICSLDEFKKAIS